MTATALPETVRSTVPELDYVIDLARSHTMYSVHEALARDRMREEEQRSRDARLARSVASERRYHRAALRRRRRSAR